MDLIQLSLLTLIAGFVVTLAIFLIQTTNLTGSSKSSEFSKPTFLILGLNSSGKTSLYYRLVNDSEIDADDKFTSTVSSMKPNITEIRLPFANQSISKKYQLVDYPGHLKYSNLLDKLIMEDIKLKNIKGIVYVIDSSSNALKQSEQIKSIAKFLFHLFTRTEKLINGIDFLFAVNKQDLFDSTPVFKVRELLEEEITKLIEEELHDRENKNSGIDKEVNEDEDSDDFENSRDFWLSVVGKSNRPFKFEILEGNMDFVAGTVLKNKIEGWQNWFDEKVVN